MTTKELKSYIDRILGNNVRCLLPSYWWKRMFGMTLDKMDADKEELIKKIQSAGSKVTVDSALSTTSTNAVQNKVVTEAINERPTALQMLEFVGNTYEDVNRSVYIGNTEDYYIVNWKEINKTNLTRNVSENEIIHFRIKYILDEYNFITLNPVSIERFPSTTADYATYYECVVCINDAYERWRIYVDGSVEFVGLENIGEASGALQFGQERMIYFETSNTPAKLTDEQKAYNAETYKMVSIDDKPVYLSYFGHWGYQKEGTFGDPNGHMIVGFLMGSKDSLQEASVRINADGSAYLIGLVNIADATLDAESERPIQNKVITEALNNKVDKVNGKQLSTEDFTSALKTKLEGLNNYDDTSIQNAVNSLTTQINTLVSGDASAAIESFNEIIAFLNGVEDSESLDSIIAAIEQQIAAKQDKLVSGTNIKTINGESILGEGNIVVNVDTSNLATKQELNAKQDIISDLETIRSGAALGATALQEHQDISHLATKEEVTNLQNEVIANEEVVATSLNDLNTRIEEIAENVGGAAATKEELAEAIEGVNATITEKETATNEAIAGVSASVETLRSDVAETYATKEDLEETNESLANLTNEILTNEEVTAAAFADLNTRLLEVVSRLDALENN